MTLTEFLTARLDEDEEVARRASPGGWRYGDVESVAGGTLYDETRRIADIIYENPEDHDGYWTRHLLEPEADANGAHIARHDPARVLAEVEAKRRIVEAWVRADEAAGSYPGTDAGIEMGLHEAIALLALPYADHPDYDPDWKP